jgi:hypothetical protein
MAASDMLIEIYMAESILRTEKLAKEGGEDKVQEQSKSKLYCTSGRYR